MSPTGDDWTTPGLFEVAAGVHRVPLPLPSDGLRAVNVYVIEDAGRLVLVDSGWNVPEAIRLLDNALAGLGSGVADIDRFLVTHVHRDHYTMAIDVRRRVGTRVGLGAHERPSLDALGHPSLPFAPQLEQLRHAGAATLVDEILAGMPEIKKADREIWEMPDDWLEAGPVTLGSGRRLDAVETPGHTRGHLVFHDATAGLLFAGDHVLPTITPSIGFEIALIANPLGKFLESLAKVRAMPDAMLLPAHGAVTGSVHERIDQLVDHHGRRLDQVLRAVDAGSAHGMDIAGRLRWTRREHQFRDLDVFNRMLAVSETLAHLDLLIAQGRVQRTEEDGIWCFLPAP